MGSLQLFLNRKHAVEFLSADYYFNEKPQSLPQINRTAVPIAWSLPASPVSGPAKFRYRGDKKPMILNRFCCQNAANFDDLASVIHGKYEGCASNATVNISALDDPYPRRGLGIVDFMKEKNFLITGATGFVAKVLIEKILRMQPDTGKLFLMIRADDPASALKRLKNEVINSALFKRLRGIYGNEYDKFMLKKLVPVAGDMTQHNLGVEEDMTDMLIKEVDIIVSSAATTTFDDRYDVSLETNTKGVYRLLEFGKCCEKVQLFLHLSTAYVNGQRQGRAPEKTFHMEHNSNPPLDIQAEFHLANKALQGLEIEFSDFQNCDKGPNSRKKIAQRLKDLGMERARIYGWQDTYVFSKAMAEMLIVNGRKDLPVVIVRPSVIESTVLQPFPGWIEGNRMLDPIITHFGKGQLSCLPADGDTVLDLIPVDMVVNATLASMVKHAGKPGVKVYHVASSIANPLTLRNTFKIIFEHFKSNPYIDKKGEPIILGKEITCLRHEEDFYGALGMASKSPGVQITRLSTELLKYMAKIYKPYTFYKTKFDISNLEKLFQELSEEEQENFEFDVKNIRWNDYLGNIHIPGLRQHVMKGRGTGKPLIKI